MALSMSTPTHTHTHTESAGFLVWDLRDWTSPGPGRTLLCVHGSEEGQRVQGWPSILTVLSAQLLGPPMGLQPQKLPQGCKGGHKAEGMGSLSGKAV